jgi:hypothetical protein
MSDFESGAFNRALPPLRFVTTIFFNRCLMLGCEMCVPHRHLKRPVPDQLCHPAQIDSGYNKSTGKSMAVAMPPGCRDIRRRLSAGLDADTVRKEMACPATFRTGGPVNPLAWLTVAATPRSGVSPLLAIAVFSLS